MRYRIKTKEIDNGTDYPLLVLSGLTGLSQQTIQRVSGNQTFPLEQKSGQAVINGGRFLQWVESVNHEIEVD